METIAAIESSLDDLENVLEPLLETDMLDTLKKLDTLQKAKLQVVLPYVVHNLLASYLKMRDIDLVTHPVSSELERIGQYFSKIENAANGPEKRTLAVDQQAATRFIKHAIREAGKQGTHIRFNTTETTVMKTTVTTSGIIPETSSTIIGAELTPAALAKIEERKKALAENDDSELLSDEDGLMVVDEEEVVSPITSKSEGKRRQKEDEVSSSKKRRKGIDPWTGFEDSTTSTANTPIATQNTEKLIQEVQDTLKDVVSKPLRKPRHKKKKKQQPTDIIDVDAESGSNGDNSQSNTPVQGKSKKKRKESKESKADAAISVSSD